jgi:uncharacterized protein YigA (DUF484 family)
MQPGPPTAGNSDAGGVAEFLRANPGWLAAHPELYAVLEPPARVHGDRLADHMAAMLDRARAGAAALAQVTVERRAAEGFAERVQDAVLAMMGARDLPWCLQHDLPGLLRLDSVRLCAEAGQHGVTPAIPGSVRVPPGTVAATLGRRRALVRDAVRTPLLHGEAAALAGREALVRVPLPASPALLALACRDGRALAGAATPVLAFLGQAIAVALARE